LAVRLDAAADPVAIEALPDGRVLILDNPPGATYSVVRCYSGKELVGAPVVLKDVLRPYISLDIQTAGLLDYSVRGQDFAFLPSTNPTPGSVAGKLFLAAADGDQSFAFDFSLGVSGLSLTLAPQYFPMRYFGGKALVSAGGQIFYDSQNRWIQLAEQPRPRFETTATLFLPPQQTPEVPGRTSLLSTAGGRAVSGIACCWTLASRPAHRLPSKAAPRIRKS